MSETESTTPVAASEGSGTAPRRNGDTKRSFQEAHRAYALAIQNAHLQAQRPYIDAYAGYLQAVGSAKPDEPLNAVYAYHDYVRNVLEATHGGEASRPYQDAYRDYLRSLKEAWAALDVDSLDPASLAQVVETMRAGVVMAHSTVGSS